MLGGFSFCSLEHALYLYPMLIHHASIGGGLLVGGIIMLIGAACVTIFYVSGYWRRICYIVFILIKVRPILSLPYKATGRYG
jgi:apolipoprotein N-acyltransferase